MRKPNLFIAGAPKCGTTSMYHCLREHPDIFMSAIKEPAFFCSDLHFLKRASYQQSRADYLTLFAPATAETVVGEASTAYFYSKQAPVEIHAFNPTAKIIIMLRNPVEMMYALHSQMLFQGDEPVRSFEEALRLEPLRKKGLHLPKATTRETLFYREVARYAQHIQNFFVAFPRQNVHIVILDDLKRNREGTLKEILQFLGVDPDCVPELPVANQNRYVRSTLFHKWINKPPRVVSRLINAVLPTIAVQRLFVLFRDLNSNYAPRPPLPSGLKKRLKNELCPEIEKLSGLLDRDLMFWCAD